MNSKYALAFLLTFFGLNCYSQNYFEGIVLYEIEYEPIANNISEKSLVEEMGDSLIAYIQEHRYLMIFNTKSDLGVNKIFVSLEEGYAYIDYEQSDTIYKYKINKKSGALLKYEHTPNDKKKILDNICESITINYQPSDTDNSYEVRRAKYYFDPRYKLNAKAYANHNENFWNLFVNKSNSISVRNEVEYYPIYRSVQQAVKVIEKILPDQIFLIDTNKYIKEIEW